MYEELKYKWDMGFITEATLRKWVTVNQRKPGAGITAEQFEEITGIPYGGE